MVKELRNKTLQKLNKKNNEPLRAFYEPSLSSTSVS